MNKRELTNLLTKITKASAEFVQLQNKLYTYCEENYGCDPSEIDNDQYLDSCTGVDGNPKGMTADKFHESMLFSMRIAGMSTAEVKNL